MSNNITNIKIPKYNLEYEIVNNKNIIEASLDKNIKLAYSCKSGICGTCKAKVIIGQIKNNDKINHILSDAEKENNVILLCQSKALSSEIVIEPLSPLPHKTNLKKARELVSEILAVKKINNTIIELSISVPKRFGFNNKRNNYVNILIPGIESKEKYPIISTLEEDKINNGVINILLSKSKNTNINRYINKHLLPGETLTIKGPYTENTPIITKEKPLLFLIENNYIIYSLNVIKELLADSCNVPIMLVCNFKNKTDIIFLDDMHKLKFVYKNFTYKISLTNEDKNNNIDRFLLGKISNIIRKVFPNLSEHCIFIYGTDEFIKENYNKSIELGAIKKNIHR